MATPKMPWQLTDEERIHVAHTQAAIDDQSKLFLSNADVNLHTYNPDAGKDVVDLMKEPFASADYGVDPNEYKDKLAQASRDLGLDASAISNVKGI